MSKEIQRLRALLSRPGCELATDATKQQSQHSVHSAMSTSSVPTAAPLLSSRETARSELPLMLCPFCGGEPEIINKSVHCNSPRCEAQPYTAGPTQGAAVASWNRRANAQSALERWGFNSSGFAERMQDGYWTPWHLAQATRTNLEALAALRRLSFAAQTTGGTAGPDAELQAAIAEAEQVLSK